MRPTILAACLVAVSMSIAGAQSPPTLRIETETPGLPAKGDKPRIAVIEFQSGANTELAVDSVRWGEWIADVERPQAAGRGIDIASVDGEIVNPSSRAAKQPKTRLLGIAPGDSKPRPAASEEGGDPDRPLVAGRVPNPRDSASGQATGKRAHKPVTITKEWGAATPQLMKLERPAQKGSVWIRTFQPWTACRIYTRYPSVELDGYKLRGLVVAGCPQSAHEGITLAYEGFYRVK